MNKKICFLVSCMGFISNFVYGQQAVISGYLKLDTTWAKKVYISRITDFNLMFAASEKIIVAEGYIDASGFFKVNFPTSGNESLYRLHIRKMNEPVSTLVIGSNDENHIFFIARDADKIYFHGSDSGKLIIQANITGGSSNTELNRLLSMINSNDIDRITLKTNLITTAEKSSTQLVGLLAIYSAFALNDVQKNRIRVALERYDHDNPYGGRIFEEYKGDNYGNLLLAAIVLFILVASVTVYRLYKRQAAVKISQLLSARESDIVRRILNGKTNKEIASELSVELSTVKTHVNNIYAKLKITNRKELMRYKEIFTMERSKL